MKRTLALTCALVIALAAGCDQSTSAPAVDWENYSPTVKTRIDAWGTASDCVALQAEFDISVQNDTAQRNRTGNGNADLMAYIDAALKRGGCY